MNRNLDRMLSLLVEEIERVEETREGFGRVLKRIKSEIDLARFTAVGPATMEASLVREIKPTKLDGLSVAGVDGGLVRRRFKSMDLLLTRGVAAIFQFGGGGTLDVEFFPDAFPEPEIRAIGARLSTLELDQLASLERLKTELKVTLNILDKYHTNLILIDGSLFYHPRDKPQPSSGAYEKFQEVVALYRQLYHKAKKKKTSLVGIIKDSRSTRVVNALGDILPHIIKKPSVFEMMQGVDYRWLLKRSRDSDLLDTFLEQGERTFAFRYSTELVQNSNQIDSLSKWASSIWVTYLKTAVDDLPLRIEMYMGSNEGLEHLDKALSVILPLSYQHPEYGIPTPIVEADTRARISQNETQLVVDRLMALSGLTYTSLERRRSRNPFGGY